MRVGWRLGVTLILFAGAAVVLQMAPPVRGAENSVSVLAFPSTLGAWSEEGDVPEETLPPDPNETLSVRRTYRHGRQVAWISVALFVGQNDEARRASVNKIYPQRGVNLIEPVSFAAPLGGATTRATALPAVVIHQGARRLLVVYWHQMGKQVYGSEYRFRLALMRDMIFARRAESMLVRIAIPASTESEMADGLAAAAGLAPTVHAALGRETVR
jgi:EpsI family protein